MSVASILFRTAAPVTSSPTPPVPSVSAPHAATPHPNGVVVALRPTRSGGDATGQQTGGAYSGADPSAAPATLLYALENGPEIAPDPAAVAGPADTDDADVRAEASELLAATLAAAAAADVAPVPFAGAGRATGAERTRIFWSEKPEGTPVDAPATRADFSTPNAEAAAHKPSGRKQWRVVEVVTALSGPAAAQLIAAADRPGPVEPGSLLEAVKVFRRVIPAPPPSTDAVV